MNKRVSSIFESIIDEDKDIKSVAHSKRNYKLIVESIIFFMIMALVALMFMLDYYQDKNVKNKDKVIEYTTTNGRVLIINGGTLNEEVDSSKLDKKGQLSVERISTIEVIPNDEDEVVNFDIRYDIKENTFERNMIATNNSALLVRFSYSYNNEDWSYINNVVSTTSSTLTPLMGSYFDIAGLLGTLKISTNNEIKTEDKKPVKMYWRSETLFQSKRNLEYKGNINANLKIVYKEVD